MYNDEIQWFSQTLLSYYDKFYQTEGYLRISISTSTKDFQGFNPCNLGISISNANQDTRVCNLNIINATDLLFSVKESMQNPQESCSSKIQILKKYVKGQNLIFDFLISSDDEKVVRITINYGETDFVNIVLPFNTFYTFASVLKSFVTNYENICMNLINTFLLKEVLSTNRNMISSIKSLPSVFVENGHIENESQPVPSHLATGTKELTEDFEKFLGNNMENIDIPELDGEENKIEKTTIQEIDSQIIKNVINEKLVNLESLLTSIEMNPDPFNVLLNILSSKIACDEDFSLTPGITEEDKKSILYLSKLICNATLRNYVDNGVAIQSNFPIIKYPGKQISDLNLEIAYDLLLFNWYLRCFRKRMEERTDDAIENGSSLYLLCRSYLDPLIFSFIDKDSAQNLQTILTSRFLYYSKLGVFKEFNDRLETYKCQAISEKDIPKFCEDIKEALVDVPDVQEFHEKMHQNGYVKIPSNNNYTLEQIINEIIPLEAAEKIGVKINENNIESFLNGSQLSSEVRELFLNQKQEKPETKKRETKKIDVLPRFINHFKSEIPESFRDDFIDHINGLGNKKFNFYESQFPLEELGEDVLKGLYIWNPESDPKMTKDYKYFFEKYENEVMTKDLILASFKDEKQEESNDWDSILDSF